MGRSAQRGPIGILLERLGALWGKGDPWLTSRALFGEPWEKGPAGVWLSVGCSVLPERPLLPQPELPALGVPIA